MTGLVLMVVIAMKPDKSGDLLTRYLFFVPDRVKERIRDIVVRFARGLEFMKDIRKTSLVAGHTILIWLGMGLANYFMFLSFGFDLPLEASFGRYQGSRALRALERLAAN